MGNKLCNFLFVWMWGNSARNFSMKKGLRNSEGLYIHDGGDEGDRTPDLLTASQALSQLSYAPVRRSTIRELARRCKDNFGKTFAGASRAVAPRRPEAGNLAACWQILLPLKANRPDKLPGLLKNLVGPPGFEPRTQGL